jgi:hypothetical protein
VSDRGVGRLVSLVQANAVRLYVVGFALFGGLLPLVYFQLPLHFDEAIFLVIGDQWANGLLPYTGMADHKPPGIFLVAALGELFVEYPHYLLRVVTYLTVAVTGVLVFLLGRKLAGRAVGMVASLVYLVATYMPHFDGYYFLTEPYANLAMVVAAVLLLADRRAYDALAGAALAVGVLFNQTVFLFGLAFIVFRALLLGDEANRTRAYLLETTERFLVIGGGFLVPTGLTSAYFYVNGLLDEMLYYAFVLPLTGYSPPFDLYGHLLAAGTLAPVWLVAGLVILWQGYRVVTGTVQDESVLFVACWAVFIGYPGATSFVGDHKLLFTFPAVGLLTAIGFERAYRAFASEEDTLVEGTPVRRLTRGSVATVSVVVVGFLLLTAASVGANGIYANNLLSSSGTIAEERADVDEVAAIVDDGLVFSYPTPQATVYYHNDSVTPVRTFATVYDQRTRSEIIEDVEQQQVEYLVVGKGQIEDDGTIRSDGAKYFVEEKAPLVEYLNEHYEPHAETDTWAVYRRTG